MPRYFATPALKYAMLALRNAKSMRQNTASVVLKSVVPARRNAEKWLENMRNNFVKILAVKSARVLFL